MIDASEHATRMATLFDALSDTYDAVGVDFFKPIAEGLVRNLALADGESLLDIGCGRGAVLIPAAQRVGEKGRATGIDISPRMIEQALRMVHEARLGNVTCLVDDAQAPKLTGTFDVITSSLVLFFLADPMQALTNWHPLLKPGGRIGVTTFGEVDERLQHVDDVFSPYLPPQMKDARTSGRNGPFASDDGVERLLVDAGYENVRTVNDFVSIRFENPEQWHAFTWSVGQRAMWLAIPEEDRPMVRKEAESRLAKFTEHDGSVVFRQDIRHTLGSRTL